MKKRKKKNRENKAIRQRDNKMSLKHTNTHTKNIKLPTGIFVCAYKC